MEEKKFKNGTVFHQLKLSDILDNPITLDKDNRRSGVVGWLGLVCIVVLYDVYAIKTKKIETLTRSFWRHTEHKIGQSIFIGAWLGLTFHLLFEKMIRKKISNRDLI
jgi:hypothetical protein